MKKAKRSEENKNQESTQGEPVADSQKDQESGSEPAAATPATKAKKKGGEKGKKAVESRTTIAHARAGAPQLYNRREIMQQIGQRIANGESLQQICEEPGNPSRYTILGWAAEDAEVYNIYRNALAMRAAHYADELIELADGAKGKSAEEVQAIKLMVNTRQWVASRLLPKLYGDHQVIEHTGQVQMNAEQVDQRLALLLRKMQAIEVKP